MALPDRTLAELGTDPTRPRALIGHLRSIGYTLPGIAALIGEPDPTALLRNSARCALLYGQELADCPTPIAVLAQLFLLGGQVPRRRFDTTVPTEIRTLLDDCALIRRTGDVVEAEVTIVEFASKYFLSDRLFAHRGAGDLELIEGQFVVWPMGSWTLDLYARLSRNPGWQSFLDVGCGSGCIALLVHERYPRTMGIDLNPRAVAFATLNAALNDAPQVTFAAADCRTFTGSAPFDHVTFAAPSGPDLEDHLDHPNLVSHGGRLGHELVLDFLATRTGTLLSPAGRAQAWAIFAVQDADLHTLISRTLPGQARVDPIREGGLYVSQTAITNRTLSWDCHYANTELQPHFLDLLEQHQIRELVPAVVTTGNPAHEAGVRLAG